jgi:hypothetical protein
MSTESAVPTARSILDVLDAPQDRAERVTRAVYWTGMLVATVPVVFWWFVDGPKPGGYALYGVLVAGWSFGLTPGVAIPSVRLAQRLIPPHGFRVPAGERVIHRMFGVGRFAWFLELSGYNRQVVRPLRRFDGTRADLRTLGQSALGGVIAHGVVFGFHVLLAGAVLLAAHPVAALWVLGLGVVLHLYPILLQRSLLLRIQPLLEKQRPGRT